jgi:hypothetical protein
MHRMALPTRQEAVGTLEEGREAIDALVSRLAGEEIVRAGTIGDGAWSVLELIGHLAVWEELALEALAEWRDGRVPFVEEVFRGSQTVDELNDERIAALRLRAEDDVRIWAAQTHRALASEIEAMTDDEWTSMAPYPAERRDRLAMLLGSVLGASKRPFGHAFAHLPDIQAYVSDLREG